MNNYRYHNECIRRNQAQGGSKPDPPSFFPWRLQWGLSVFQWGSNPHNPPANFYPVDSINWTDDNSRKRLRDGQQCTTTRTAAHRARKLFFRLNRAL